MDLTQNTNLEVLHCTWTALSSLDLTQNTNLKYLDFSDNFQHFLGVLDLTQNTNLEYLDCRFASLSSLDLTQNTNLEYLVCNSNQLSRLDIRNGNNHNMGTMIAYDNDSNLICILVDDETATYPVCVPGNPYTGWCKHPNTIYTENPEDCILGLEDFDSTTITIFPNPTQYVLNIESQEQVENIKIYSLQGILLKQAATSSIDVSQLSPGIYFALVAIDGKTSAKKFVKL